MAGKKIRITFDEYYAAIFGDRWEGLEKALHEPVKHAELDDNLVRPYFLDPASRMAAEALNVEPGDRVLDLCAAPGGKTLVLAAALGKKGSLIANERSADRRHRLLRVLKDHLPADTLSLVRVTGRDALTWGLYEKDAYDKILLDAPCSSERHVLNSPRHLLMWSPSRTKRLAAQAYTMLLSAFMAAAPGGTILYCTCALSPLENDGVVERVFIKHGSKVRIVPPTLPGSEPTKYGVRIFPDKFMGYGPLYLSKMIKPLA